MNQKFDNESDNPKTQHRIPGMDKKRRVNTYVTMDNPDDNIEVQDGDNRSLLIKDNPDDYEEG